MTSTTSLACIDGHEQAPITEGARPPRTSVADHLASMPTATRAAVAAGETGWATAAATLTGMAYGMARFVQTFPPLPDVYAGDHVLRATLVRLLGEVGHKSAAPLLEALAAEVAGQLRAAHTDAETHPPILRRYDAWGRRVDEVATAPGWEVLRQASARHGLVALPYEPDARASWGAGARVVQLALLHLFAPESATYSCPVAMTDGAVTVLQSDGVAAELRNRVLPRLLSRDPAVAWTSGQWMTEATGGSDVGRTSTRASRGADGGWRLSGEKWFCSAVTSEVAVVLAREDGAPAGSRGLACFVVPRYAEVAAGSPGHAGGTWTTATGLRLHRLKDKLGTRALPSAEVGLDDALAWPVGDPAAPGLPRMMRLVLVTRLHNAAAAAAGMRRGLMLARNHAAGRSAFGTRLDQQPLHRETLSWLAVDAEAAFALTALAFALLGRLEVDGDAAAATQLRVVSPLAKALTAKLAVASASEYVECFGGNGYIEETGIPRLLRDAQVLPIWEGTTAIQSLDLLRALADDRVDGLAAYLRRVDDALDEAEQASADWLAPLVARLRPVRDAVAETARDAVAGSRGSVATRATAQAQARDLLVRMGNLLAAAALLEQATYDVGRGDTRSALVATLWSRRRLLGEAAAGAGHRSFAHVVDGAPL